MKAIVANYEGEGILADHTGKKIPVRYALDEYEQKINVGDGEKMLGMRSISGSVLPTNQERLLITRDPFILQLQDGREINGFVVDLEGGFKCTGGFFS